MLNRVSLKFVELSDPALDEFAANCVASLTGNAAFPNLPVLPAALGTLRLNFHNAILAASDGGKRLTALKDEARVALEMALRKDAAYVQSIADEDLALLLSSGFKAVNPNRTSVPLDTPVILNVDNQATSKLFADLDSIANAAAYQVKVSTPQGEVLPTIESTRSRRIEVQNLVPGTVYTLRARAIGGSTGYSEWSLPTSIMAT